MRLPNFNTKTVATDNRQAPEKKKSKKFEPADLVCPITLELPWDPVMAEDGRVYERAAIEEHITTHRHNLKSPMTGLPMGVNLLTALQHKNTIEALIESDVLEGDLVSKWNEKVKEKKAMENLLKKADDGDAEAMHNVGLNYRTGEYGFKTDQRMAYSYFSKSHAAGNQSGTAMVGQCSLFGWGVEKCERRGFAYLGLAAGKGSKFASCKLATSLAGGHHGIVVDKEEAIRWLRVVLDGECTVDDITKEELKKAQDLFDELTATAATS